MQHCDPFPAPPEASLRWEPPSLSRSESYPLQPNSSSLDTRGPSPQKHHTSKSKQLSLSFDRLVLKDQLAHRILSIDPEHREGLVLAECHTIPTHKICRTCDKPSVHYNRCDRRWCPVCSRRVARERQQQLVWWFGRVRNPKMLTLTVRNLDHLTPDTLKWFKDRWTSLRRSKLFQSIAGGFWSIEITNQGRGWHIHIHAVLDCPYLPQDQIEAAWSKRIGQDKSIVDIRALRGPDALKEVVKYTAKPTQMVHWSDSELLDFLSVARGTRFFGVWGNLHAQRADWKEWIESVRSLSSRCECGCNNWRILDPPNPDLHRHPPQKPQPPPQLFLDLDMRNQQAIQAMMR